MTAPAVFAIDPGPTESAFVLYVAGKPVEFGKIPNEMLLGRLRGAVGADLVTCEQVRSYGMPVGAEVFDTVEWSGRFHQEAISVGLAWGYVPRLKVKLHLCGSARAKDGNIIQALKDRFGGKGTKAAPGVLYGFRADAWQALALAVTVADGAAA